MAGVYEINVNVNGANAGTDGKKNNVGKSAAAGALGGAAASSSLTGGLNIGGRGSGAAEKMFNRGIAKNIMKESISSGTGTSFGQRVRGMATGAGFGVQNISGRQAVGGISAVAGAYTAILAYQQQGATLRGEGHKADRLGERQTKLTEGLTIGVAFAIAGPLGGIAVMAATAWKYAQENRKLVKELQNETVRSAYYSRRLVYDISERR